MDVITALKALTIWPAWQHYEEKTKGSIEVGKLADFVILSRDPTKGDPNTIDQIKVTETVKEGATIFKLTAEEQRKADLMHRPGRDGSDAFNRFLTAAAVYRDAEQLPAYLRQPGTLAYFRNAPHDRICLGRSMDDLVLAMIGGDGPAR